VRSAGLRGSALQRITTNRIVVLGVDGSADSRAAVDKAIELCSATSCRLLAVHVLHVPRWWWMASEAPIAVEPSFRRMLDDIGHEVQRLFEEQVRSFDGQWDFILQSGDPATCLLSEAENHHALAVVVGGRGHRPYSPVTLGSVASKLLHHAPVSVLIVRAAVGQPRLEADAVVLRDEVGT
jgi:nucleotide-binding universal stress UspA family protein